MSEAPNTGTPPAAPAAPPAAPAAPAAGDPWYHGADAEIVGFIQSKGWHEKTPQEAALEATRSYREAQGFIGAPPDRIVKLPTDANDADAWKPVWQRLGVPADAKEYDFSGLKFADGSEIAPEFSDWLRTQSHALNIPKDAAQRLGAEFVKYMDGTAASGAAARTAQVTEEFRKLAENWGGNIEGFEYIAKAGAKALGVTDEEYQSLKDVPGGARMLEIFRKVGELNGEGRFIGGGNGPNGTGGIMTKEQAADRKSMLMQDSEFVARYNRGDTKAYKEMYDLNLIIAGGDDSEASRR